MASMNRARSRAMNFPTAALTEIISPVAELALLLTDPIFWGFGVPRGDGHPVMLVPGLFANDDYLQPMSNWLRRAGYHPLWSGLPFDPGFSEFAIRRIVDAAREEHRRSGARLTIIGHSMGGALAREAALRIPESVRHLITLGSPMDFGSDELLSRSIPHTAIYTRSDVIVRYPFALARDSHAENIEVSGSHSGLAMNAQVYRHLARVLAASRLE